MIQLQDTIQKLRHEHAILTQAIATLEQLENGTGTVRKSTRGRKSMGMEERKQVSERMRRFWAARRKGTK